MKSSTARPLRTRHLYDPDLFTPRGSVSVGPSVACLHLAGAAPEEHRPEHVRSLSEQSAWLAA